jgi:hypothetical protein
MMALDEGLLREAEQARDHVIGLQHDAEQAQVSYQHSIRRLHASGGSMREIADALGLSYQRVHQIVDVSTGKGAVRPSKIDGYCSFCGAKRAEVRKLIAGPGVLICDRCVDLADKVLAEGAQRSNELALLVALDLGSAKVRCSFCGKRRDRVSSMVLAPLRPGVGKYAKRDPGVRICNDCLKLCDEILSDEVSVGRG